ncbi:hypothetical protein [Trichormus azollae]|uniref:hypothetical protein n=1 Tax=Trichormus azollae TaxID=1164 RepID=UPI00325C5986
MNEVIIQDMILATDNVLYRKKKYYSPLEGKTYLAEPPCGYEEEFGPGIKTLIISLYYGGNMTQGKLLEFLEEIDLLKNFQLPTKWKNFLQILSQETMFSEAKFHTLLDTDLPKLVLQQRIRIMKAAAIAFSHQQTDWLVVQTLVCSDAPQSKLITDNIALFWVDQGRRYKKLSPFIACHQQVLDQFLDDFWNYYRDLLTYQDSPSQQTADEFRYKFWKLFDTDSCYQQLHRRKRLNLLKISKLSYVLEHPELPLHNDSAELAARNIVQGRNISYTTQTLEGIQAWDTFVCLVATARKLGISFFEHIRDRISQVGNIPCVATIYYEKSALNPFGCSWIPE